MTPTSASLADLPRDPLATVASGGGAAVAILPPDAADPAFYCVPAAEYEAMLDRIEDAELNAIADARANSPEIPAKLDGL
ncbi:plasmid stabilization protein [Paracoccus sp. PAR01]|uniref:plasmid stabilization protein n=1 Tax=Paracoccus sp. PAR01 TaxID=2769282 RepID=UPI001782001B|nr:plasmid stabilization protein [Paracoccus sp. PAR01]MBD9526212.1 plasmid stabilization protein [Paracoccus sp. PAR01]